MVDEEQAVLIALARRPSATGTEWETINKVAASLTLDSGHTQVRRVRQIIMAVTWRLIHDGAILRRRQGQSARLLRLTETGFAMLGSLSGARRARSVEPPARPPQAG